MMRAKMYVFSVKKNIGVDEPYQTEELMMYAVAKTGPYPQDGSDEDNTYAKFSPMGQLMLTIANPALFGKFKAGQKFYVDFTEAQS